MRSSSRPTFATRTSKSWVAPAVSDVESAPLISTCTPYVPGGAFTAGGGGGAGGVGSPGGGASSFGMPSRRLIAHLPELLDQPRAHVLEDEVYQEADEPDQQDAQRRDLHDLAELVRRGLPRHLEDAAVPPFAQALDALLDPLLDLPGPL